MTIFAWCIVSLSVLLLVALPTGAIMMTLLVVATLLSLGLATVCLAGKAQASAEGEKHRPMIAWACVALLLFFWITMIPMPLGLSALGGALRGEQNQAAYEAIENVVALELCDPEPGNYALTRNKSGTARVALLAAAAIAAALLTSRLSRRAKMIYLRFLLMVGLIIAVLGYISMRSKPQGDTLWWTFTIPHGLPGPIACFTNPNHFAAFLAILCPVSLALFVHDLTKRQLFPGLFNLATFGFLSLTIVYTLSRGALVAYGCGMIACAGLFLLQRRWIAGGTMIAIGIVAVITIINIPHPVIRERMQTFLDLKSTDSYQTRAAAWSDSKTIFRHYPAWGAGANGFRIVYPQFRTTSQGAQVTSHAENEYVQWAVDTGIIGILLALTLLLLYGREAVFHRLRPHQDSAITVAVIASISTAAAHAFLDYPLHIPLYAIPLASIAGLILPQSLASRVGSTPTARLLHALPLICVAFLSVGLVRTWGLQLHYDSIARIREGEMNTIVRALRFSPSSAFAWYYLGRKVSKQESPETRLLALHSLRRATRMDPNNYKLWYRVGRRMNNLGDLEGAAHAFARVKELRDWHQVPYLPKDLTDEHEL
jgi:hypothetical protein